ncbi:hypothetical protein DAEQUDRAFT_550250 [Daedalea quercina L-15889]|uniref:Uncharacterized protein n=1 Tax=Daedalea quercina L-15889 TaxID=1314783 RepID=A0A165T328_9APHY|nr:hypothetical protein DAEQUDRAFT_550250 [Daedalea quercina L-15889]
MVFVGEESEDAVFETLVIQLVMLRDASVACLTSTTTCNRRLSQPCQRSLLCCLTATTFNPFKDMAFGALCLVRTQYGFVIALCTLQGHWCPVKMTPSRGRKAVGFSADTRSHRVWTRTSRARAGHISPTSRQVLRVKDDVRRYISARSSERGACHHTGSYRRSRPAANLKQKVAHACRPPDVLYTPPANYYDKLCE